MGKGGNIQLDRENKKVGIIAHVRKMLAHKRNIIKGITIKITLISKN
jgi:hypothetical protein